MGKKAKLGMTVRPPKADPYKGLSSRMQEGENEENILEGLGAKTLGPRNKPALKDQKRIPRLSPAIGTRRSKA